MNQVDDPQQVALQLERLRHSIDVGLTAIRGDLALLLQRNEQTERRMDALEQRTDAAAEDLSRRVSAIESNRWPLRAITAVAAVIAAAAAVAALVLGG